MHNKNDDDNDNILGISHTLNTVKIQNSGILQESIKWLGIKIQHTEIYKLTLKNSSLDEFSYMKKGSHKLWDRNGEESLSKFGTGSGDGEGVGTVSGRMRQFGCTGSCVDVE